MSCSESPLSGSSSSPGSSCTESQSGVHFEGLWKQLRECHLNALQELEAKVTKLRKERCLDAQRLEVFYIRNQQLKEQNKSLQQTVGALEDRLRAGGCERCAILEDNLKTYQEQNTLFINKIEQENNAFKDDNKKLTAELDKLKIASSDIQRSSSPDPDDCVIPDSPVMASSLPAANKLKKRKDIEKSKFVCYAERSLPLAHTSLFMETGNHKDVLDNPGQAEGLVPNTCELDASQADEDLYSEEVVVETCRLDLPPCRKKKESAVRQQKTRVLTKSCVLASTNPRPDSATEPSRAKRFSNDCLNNNMAKRKKAETQLEEDEKERQATVQEVEKKNLQTLPPKREQSALFRERSFEVGNQSHSDPDETLIERPNVSSFSPVFKKPNAMTIQQKGGKNKPALKDRDQSLCPDVENSPREHKVEPMWSIDPALALEMYESERGTDENNENDHLAESADSDCTLISHSLLQGRVKNENDGSYISGLGEKANDSLDRLFDTSACGEYKSFGTLNTRDNDQPSDHDEDEAHHEDDAETSLNKRKAGQPSFAHVAVIRKKDERRKLKGTTCKECEIYYAHLPEEERQKKLTNCSRHRFLYIPPCTPENFWEVGFPSTQTCIDRGYVKEEQTPQSRTRRRQPLNALFSPKGKKKET